MLNNYTTSTPNITIGLLASNPSSNNQLNNSAFASLISNDDDYHYPISSVVYQMETENTVDLLSMLCDEMKKCPNENINLNITELASLNGLDRSIEFVGKGEAFPKTKALVAFRSNFFSQLSMTNEFMTLDESKVWNVKDGKSLHELFSFPESSYDYNGNHVNPFLSNSKISVVVLWKDSEKLKEVLLKLSKHDSKIEMDIIALTIGDDFFKKKKYIHDNDLANKASFYFEDSNQSNNWTFDYSIDPLIQIINSEGVIKYDEAYNPSTNLNEYLTIMNLIANSKEYYSEKELIKLKASKVNEWWWALSNEDKEQYINIVNQKFNDKGFNELYFNIASEISMNNKGGIYKWVQPHVVGLLPKKSKNIFDSLIKEIATEGQLEDIMTNIAYRE